MIFCKECQEGFENEAKLHRHLRKHGMLMGEYYVKHYQRKNPLTGELIEFKNTNQYFTQDFENKKQMRQWLAQASRAEAQKYILGKFTGERPTDYAPSHLELCTTFMPEISDIKEFFGDYISFCDRLGKRPYRDQILFDEFMDPVPKTLMFIDSREKKPLDFAHAGVIKLDYGDYATKESGAIAVERKTFGDFANTMGQGFERFTRELDRAVAQQGYIFVVIECKITSCESLARSGHQVKLPFVFQRMRKLQRDYCKHCQFVFSGSRKHSMELIPRLLHHGDKLKKVDMQYFWETCGK